VSFAIAGDCGVFAPQLQTPAAPTPKMLTGKITCSRVWFRCYVTGASEIDSSSNLLSSWFVPTKY
jgi:hypothetical protein